LNEMRREGGRKMENELRFIAQKEHTRE